MAKHSNLVERASGESGQPPIAFERRRSEAPGGVATGSVGRGLRERLRTRLLSGILALAGFTFVVNLLLLVQPVYMLQVYDRVLASGSIETLAFISIAAVLALLLLGAVDALRGLMASRVAARLEVELGADALVASLNGPRAALGDVQPMRDLATVRAFISNRALLAYLDLPFAPLFIGLLYVIHPHLFWMTAGGAVVLTFVAVLNERWTSRAASDPGAMNAMLSAQAFARSAETIKAMGMVSHVTHAWGRDEASALRAQDRIAAINATFAGLSRVLRLGLQIAILGYGGYLVLESQMTAGMIFASSLISGRGLQPIDQVIGGWKGIIETRKAWDRLKSALERAPAERHITALPAPKGRITLDQVVVFAANANFSAEPLLKRVSAEIPAGECVAVIGPSGAGKSTLARVVVGVMQVRSGAVRVDGADIRHWDPETLGGHVGYLSQDADLLPGTVAQNIARFDPAASDADIVLAAEKAEVHDLILKLSGGYDTLIGPGGQQLSGGQRQRIGLARAFFGSPKILVLDEPNANLDSDGDNALERAIRQAKVDGVTVLVVTQRRHIVALADRTLVLRDGAVEDYGPSRDVAERLARKASAPQTPAVPAPATVREQQQRLGSSFANGMGASGASRAG